MTLTDPFDLPPVAPKISDSQRAAVFAAEYAVEARHDLEPMGLEAARAAVDEITANSDAAALAVQAAGSGGDVEYSRQRSLLEMGTEATAPAVLHELAHHLTSPVFPAHGIEWIGSFLALLERFLSVDLAREYRAEFESRKDIHTTAKDRIDVVRKRVRGSVNREPGCLTRLVIDNPPEQILGQLLEVTREGLRMRTLSGERTISNEQLRYVSSRLRV